MNTWVCKLLSLIAAALMPLPAGNCCSQARAAAVAPSAACPHCQQAAAATCHEVDAVPQAPACRCVGAPQATLTRGEQPEASAPDIGLGFVTLPINASAVTAVNVRTAEAHPPGPSLQSLFCIWRN